MNKELIIGIVASLFSAISLVPQLLKLIKEKKAENISISMLIMLFVGLSFWVYYGVLHKDWIIIISNSFSVFINLLIMIFTLKYKKK